MDGPIFCTFLHASSKSGWTSHLHLLSFFFECQNSKFISVSNYSFLFVHLAIHLSKMQYFFQNPSLSPWTQLDIAQLRGFSNCFNLRIKISMNNKSFSLTFGTVFTLESCFLSRWRLKLWIYKVSQLSNIVGSL